MTEQQQSRRRSFRAVAGLVALSVAFLLPLAAGPPAPAAAAPEDPVYAVSVGDSYIAGEGARWVANAEGNWDKGGVPAEVKAKTDRAAAPGATLDQVYPPREALANGSPGCHRSDAAEIMAAEGAPSPSGMVTETVNIACSGATTKHLLSGYEAKGERSQIEQLRELVAKRKISHVVISIGGNDALIKTINDCVKSWWNSGYCSTDPAVTGSYDLALKSVEKDVGEAIRQIKGIFKGKSAKTRIIVQSYPNPLGSGDPATTVGDENSWSRWSTFGCPFYNRDIKWIGTQVLPGLTAELKKVAKTEEVDFLDLRGALAGHEVCSTEPHLAELTPRGRIYVPKEADAHWARYMERSKTGIPATENQEPLHPNFLGAKAQGHCLSEFLNALAKAGKPVSAQCQAAAGKGPKDVEVKIAG
ncbi:SGNH/GDSL hydrolase family protein [Streptomyces lasiicapitis]|uniref:SGNH/GDSL hydrolase family protein n=1 Tax=Streptomyces lasiicapitis TaxID=1923961 RepID=UPI0033257330